ncbi:MAG: ABC transporter permease [Rhodospirillaceae bacterium]
MAMAESGPQSLMIVTVISALIGMILAFIGAMELRKFGAEIYVANLVGLAMVREMAAVMTGIVIAGKTGTAFASRIGTMQAQEELALSLSIKDEFPSTHGLRATLDIDVSSRHLSF